MNRLTVIAGPTAVGKGTIVRWLLAHDPNIQVSISATTRSPRPDEVHGQSYYFVTDEEFDQMVEHEELLEYALVHGQNRYGTPRKPVEEALRSGREVILEIDLQGARQIRKSMPSANLIFIAPPNWEELERRLAQRGTETPEQIAIRLKTAEQEMAAMAEFDHVVINHEVAQCGQEVLDLIQAS